MKETQPSRNNQPDYWRLTQELINQYAPTALRAIKTDTWPDTLADSDLAICEQTTGKRVADISFEAGPDGWAHLTMPADYTQPMLREPFSAVDAKETLSPAGELLCEIIELIDYIITSPHGELTNQRELASLIEELHQQHNYSPGTIRTQLVEEAQRRGDLPNTVAF